MYCLAEVDGRIVQVILDSGSAGSVISQIFLQKLKGQISRKTNVNMVGINGEKSKALGEVKQLPIRIQGQILPADVIVSEATGYDLLVGNDWLTKYQAVLDWPNKEFRFKVGNKEFIEPATCWKKLTIIEDPDDEFEEENDDQ